jgi:hypothetical protein
MPILEYPNFSELDLENLTNRDLKFKIKSF